MAVADAHSLKSFLESADGRALELSRLVETADSLYLGALGLDRKHPLFHSIRGFGFSGELSNDASFRLEPTFHPGRGEIVHVAIFRQFDASPYQDHPEDIILGWFSEAARAQGESWLATMADLLRERLAERADRPTSSDTTEGAASADTRLGSHRGGRH